MIYRHISHIERRNWIGRTEKIVIKCQIKIKYMKQEEAK